MIFLNFSPAKCNQDELVKQRAAQKQMRELLQRLEGGVKYRILTQQDRATLLDEGFARELVDNLIYLTLGEEENRKQDQQISGFTQAALDPSLYGSKSILENVQSINDGCCSYCESFLGATGEGSVQHFRPASQVQHQFTMRPSPYLPLAYAQENLLYTCKACHEQHKGYLFPVEGPRFPDVAITDEKAMLINPYVENPRDFIRFNPLNGQAYPYDLVVKYFQECHEMSINDIETKLWRSPDCIPLMALPQIQPNDSHHEGNETPDATQVAETIQLNKTSEPPSLTFQQWLAKQNVEQANSRGAVTISCLGLNRMALVEQRIGVIGQLFLEFSRVSKVKNDNELPIEEVTIHQFHSLTIDAINTWQHAIRNEKETKPSITLERLQTQLPQLNTKKIAYKQQSIQMPMWLVSSLLYFVPEDELALAGKRRLVGLFSQDKYYGKGYDNKCLFLDANWSSVTDNVIKVRDKKHTWETSFSELALSREMDVREIFASNEVWVEGEYAALS